MWVWVVLVEVVGGVDVGCVGRCNGVANMGVWVVLV